MSSHRVPAIGSGSRSTNDPNGVIDLDRPAGDPTNGGSSVRVTHVKRWLLIGMIIAVAGFGMSVYTARADADRQVGATRVEFRRDALEVTGLIDRALQHQADLVLNAGAYMAADSDGAQAEFAAWLRFAQVRERYPEVFGLGLVVVVAGDELSTFKGLAATVDGSLVAADIGAVVPAGPRDHYCLSTVGFVRDTSVVPPAYDWCADGALSLVPAPSATTASAPVEIHGRDLITVSAPIYRHPTASAAGVTAGDTFVGWVGTVSDPQVILDSALTDHDELGISMRFENDTSPPVAVGAMSVHDGGWSNVVDLGNGWVVTVTGARHDASILNSWTSAVLLFTGWLLSVVFGAFIFVLGTGRGRAVSMVATRTGELRHQALHDPLTGLPNRTLIIDRIDQLLVRNRRQHTSGAALYLDIDNFKDINDTVGHEVGDHLLVAVASRLVATLRDADTIGRMGGDEFVILVDGSTYGMTAELVAQRVIDVMRHPFEIVGLSSPLRIRATIGVAVGDREIGSELLRDADVALYHAKANGKDRLQVFQADMQTNVLRRVDLETALRKAVHLEQFTLMYQPIYELDSLTPIGVEALLRWRHPTLDDVSPDEFVPILEQTGLIRPVGRWVLHAACSQMAIWNRAGHHLEISVNVSSRQLDDDVIVSDIRDALDSSGLDPRLLIIEITETALMRNVTSTVRTLGAIRALGIRIAVDDFGTGYSSLAYLQRLPVDSLKIDRTFIRAIHTSSESRALIKTLVQLGRDLNLTTLAEGVETTEELDHCRREQVDHVQGYLLSRPLDVAGFETRILSAAPGRQPAPERPANTARAPLTGQREPETLRGTGWPS
jgi:diguanylate cyclase (GGDEF)-like protein